MPNLGYPKRINLSERTFTSPLGAHLGLGIREAEYDLGLQVIAESLVPLRRIIQVKHSRDDEARPRPPTVHQLYQCRGDVLKDGHTRRHAQLLGPERSYREANGGRNGVTQRSSFAAWLRFVHAYNPKTAKCRENL